jgi:hypothetical protein
LNKTLLIAAISFFLVVNTSYFWRGHFFLWELLAFFLLIIIFGVLVAALVLQVAHASEEKFRNKGRNVTIAIVAVVICLVGYRPAGLVDFERFGSRDLLVAQREGAANCMTTFRLKENKTFREVTVCFGTTKAQGRYSISNDTITFSDIEYYSGKEFYKYAIITPVDSFSASEIGDLVLYRSRQDTIPLKLWIVKNELDTR